MKVGIIGYGWVGKAMKTLFPDAFVYDPYYKLQGTEFWPTNNTISKKDINQCEIAFICVPTPSDYADWQGVDPINEVPQGPLITSIVEEVVAWCECPLLVIRSTLNPGTADALAQKYNKRIVVQPEYLGETINHPLFDQKARQFMILGGETKDRRTLIDLYTQVYNANVNIRQVTRLEAEIIKLSENRAIAFKVAQCQELYDVCELAGVDYYTIREAVYSDDPRFNLHHTFIFPDNRGMNSKCIPKDVYAWCAWAESLGYDPELTRALLERNKKWISQS